MENWQYLLRYHQPLHIKEKLTMNRIKTFGFSLNENIYVSFSGGKDSTVLLHLVRRVFPRTVAMFIDTGLEYPEIRQFVKSTDNVIIIRPKMSFVEVISKYGYPVITKEQSQFISEFRTTKSCNLKHTRIVGNKSNRGKISQKWLFLTKKPYQFKISHQCCSKLKKDPAIEFEKRLGLFPIIGNMAEESQLRKQQYISNGCNSFNSDRIKSNPLSFWSEKDIWDYIHKYNLAYSKIYDMGYKRTGCMFCGFGVHDEPELNKFQKMSMTHPLQYDYCINKLGMDKVLDIIGIPYKLNSLQIGLYKTMKG
jgi:3'-phosphoadenosine 5'-phosphosulfate sulfotransferase (PAPS reductase)/FAD synthetase